MGDNDWFKKGICLTSLVTVLESNRSFRPEILIFTKTKPSFLPHQASISLSKLVREMHKSQKRGEYKAFHLLAPEFAIGLILGSIELLVQPLST
jgi:hypothetical protein